MASAKKSMKNIWITNVSKRDIHISDLGLVVKSYTSIKILNNPRLRLTPLQVLNSIKSGTIHKKRRYLVIGTNTPNQIVSQTKEISTQPMPDRSRSLKEIKEETYEELMLSDEDYMQEIIQALDKK